MKNLSSSKRLNMILNTIWNLMNLLSNNSMMQNFGMTEEQVNQVCTLAIHQTAQAFGVQDSTVYSKCVREIGFSTKVEFVSAVIKQMAHVGDTLYYALHNHMTTGDNSWDIEKALGLPFNYGY